MTSLTRYGGYSPQNATEDAAKVDSIGGSNFYTLDEGMNVVRFIPPKPGKSPLRVTGMHYVEIPGNDKTLVFACPRIELKEACPVCAEAERLARGVTKLERDRAYKLKAKVRVYASVVDRTLPNPTEAVRILGFGPSIHKPLQRMLNDKRLGGDFTNPTESGFDVLITREGTGINTSYPSVQADRSQGPLAPTVEEVNEIIENQPNLDSCVTPIVPEEILAHFRVASMQASLPAAPTGPRPGAALMGRQVIDALPVQSDAAADAKVVAPIYDDDFNIITP